eukprot:5275365-Pyramimonas_sp.AAC.1
MSHRLWVGDFSQTVRGSRVAVRHQLVDCLVDTCQQLQDHGLKVSPKSVVVCTFVADARMVVRRVAARGFQLKVASQAAYVGADLPGGRRRGRAARRARAKKHTTMSKKIMGFARAL